jgi:uncharacterized Fe-S cluster-containing protein
MDRFVEQKVLDMQHDFVMNKIEYYVSGIITLREFQASISEINLDNVKGLIDTATGLRY